jgi:hypothetical protein
MGKLRSVNEDLHYDKQLVLMTQCYEEVFHYPSILPVSLIQRLYKHNLWVERLLGPSLAILL